MLQIEQSTQSVATSRPQDVANNDPSGRLRREERDTMFGAKLTNRVMLINALDEMLTHYYRLQQSASASFCCRPDL
jgi:hypothetical protein